MPKGKSNVSATRKVEVFRPGTFTAMNGQSYAFSDADVSAIADNYDAEAAPAPVVVGHPKSDDPAFGWASGFEVNDKGVLVAEVGQLAPAFISAVEDGRYRKISMKFFEPEHPANPKPGQYYPRHIGFLGGAAPAVPGLAPVQFADGDEGMVEIEYLAPEFADPALENVGGLFRRIREWFIETHSREEADQVLPEWRISWIEEAAREAPVLDEPGFSAATPNKNEDTSMADEAALAVREAALKTREQKLTHDENVAFVDSVIDDGKIIPASKDDLVAVFGELASSGEDIAFADGSTKNPVDLLKSVLKAQPKIFETGEVAGDDDAAFAAGNAAFSTADGEQVDREGLELHQKALAYQRTNPGIAYIDAAMAVQGGLS